MSIIYSGNDIKALLYKNLVTKYQQLLLKNVLNEPNEKKFSTFFFDANK